MLKMFTKLVPIEYDDDNSNDFGFLVSLIRLFKYFSQSIETLDFSKNNKNSVRKKIFIGIYTE